MPVWAAHHPHTATPPDPDQPHLPGPLPPRGYRPTTKSRTKLLSVVSAEATKASSPAKSSRSWGGRTSSHAAWSAAALAPPPNLAIRHATPEQYWAIADAHTLAFYGERLSRFCHSVLRADRVMALHAGYQRAGSQCEPEARFACLVATTEAVGGSDSSDRQRDSTTDGAAPAAATMERVGTAVGAALADKPLFWLVDLAVRLTFTPLLRQRLGRSHAAAGVWGAVTIDTLADFIPPRREHKYGVTRCGSLICCSSPART